MTRGARAALASVVLLSCGETPSAPDARDPAFSDVTSAVTATPSVVISQVYGGGGNSGATLTNDFIELFNPGGAPVSVDGWSVQYASSTGSTWNVTALSGTIQPGAYYLVQQAAGSGGTTPLPTPDATGTAAMAAGAGKVVLSSAGTQLGGTCPDGGTVVDRVGYGSSNCGVDWLGNTPTLNNTTAALRNDSGCAYTGNPENDFSTGAPAPRNSSSPAHTCGGVTDPVAATVTVAPLTASVITGATQPFTASAQNAGGSAVSTSFTWTSSDEAVATVDAAGVASALSEGATTITATAANGVSGDATLTVTAPATVSGDVVISQLYGGGGNSGATLTHDFVELFNRGDEAADITGWKVHYTSSAGTSWSNTVTLGSASIPAGGYFLVRLATNNAAVGGPMPAPDATGSINMAAGAGKVVLTTSDVTLTGACPTDAAIADRVNFGSANCSGAWGTTSTLSSSIAAFRLNDGCTNTGNVSDDFFTGTPSPRNSASPLRSCDETPPPAATATLVINEIMADPLRASGGASWGEWFEVHNYGTEAIDLEGWTIASAGQPPHVIASSVIVAAGAYAVLGRGFDPAQNGGVALDYNYFTGSTSTIWLDATDHLLLRDGDGATVDSVRWTNSSTFVKGATRALRDASQHNADVGGANWGYPTTSFGDGDLGTPGAANGTLTDTPPPVPNTISFSGRQSSEPALPVGFEDQLFATLRDGSGVTVPTTFTWSAETPALASIDQNGVMRALAAGTARFRATAADGTTATYALPMAVATASSTALYVGNTEFGVPADGDPSDDFIITRSQYTASWNPARGIPNWVSFNLEATHFGPEDRCDCFTFDPELPFTPYTTADYTGAGAHHGYGLDRGHIARSFDRTAASYDNATTYYFTNIVPQAADNNQGPWAALEAYLGDLARFQDRELYIIAGAAGSIGTVKDEGRITIPEFMWKIAVILPRDHRLPNVTSWRDVEVVAVIMPNVPGIRNVDWRTYITTVDAVEALSGYDLLALLPDHIELAVESGAARAVEDAIALVNQLIASGAIGHGNGSSLDAKLSAALAQIERGRAVPAAAQLQAFLNQVRSLEADGVLATAHADALRAAVQPIIDSLRL